MGWVVRWALLTIALGCLDGSAAAAQSPSEPWSPSELEARALFEAGSIAYDAGRFEAALARYQEAYALSGLPVLLWNIALAADRARQDELALETYERFLAETEDTPATMEIRERARARVQVMHRSLDEAAAAAARAEAAELEAQRAAEREREAREAVERERQARAADAARADSSRVIHKWWFWTAIGVGLATAIAVPVAVTAGGSSATAPFPETDHGNVVFAISGRF